MLEDERTASLSSDAFRLFIAAILIADDHGNLRANPAQLEGMVFWARNPRESVAKLLETLASVSLVVIYEVRGQRYAHLNGWEKHQKVDKPGKPRMPLPTDPEAIEIKETIKSSRESREDSRDCRETLDTDLRPPTSDQGPPTSDLRPPTDLCPAARVPSRDEPATTRSLTREKAEALVRTPDVDAVVDHYVRYHPRSRPGEKERQRIRARLKERYSAEDLCRAIDGCHVSPHHCGHNDTGTKYQSLELILRDSAHVTQFIEVLEQHQSGELVPAPPRNTTAIERHLDDVEQMIADAESRAAAKINAPEPGDEGEYSGELRLRVPRSYYRRGVA